MARKPRSKRAPSSPESKRQALILSAVAIIAALVMILVANPWRATTTADDGDGGRSSSGTGQTGTAPEGKRTKQRTPSGSLTERARSMFTGDAEGIANEVRDLLNAPEDSNVDSLSNLLYRHGQPDLAEATDLYDAIGQQKDVAEIRRLAREWYPKAMQVAIDARREDLSSNLAGAGRAADRLDGKGLASTQGCSDLRGAYETAKRLVDAASADYDALTKAQQKLTSAMSGCATNLDDGDMAEVFGQPQGTRGKE